EAFEGYRCLGDHIAWAVFSEAVKQLAEDIDDPVTCAHVDYVPQLFSRLQNLWAEPPQALSGPFLQLAAAWSGIQSDLARRPEFADLARDLYPELPAAPGGAGVGGGAASPMDTARADLHTVARMLQLMEDGWISL